MKPTSLARLRRLARRILATVVLGVLAFLVWERVTFEREDWIADYEQLKAHVSGHYANLLWLVDERGLDPVALDRGTMALLQAADTDREARAAIVAFVAAFHDGHFRVHRTKLSKRLEVWWAELWVSDVEATALRATTPGADACTALGIFGDEGGLAFELEDAPEFTPMRADDRAFAAGTLALGDRRFGILRIPIFDQARYRSACIRAWDAYRERIESECDEHCIDDFVHLELPNRLLAELSATVHALAELDIHALVVDITRNGGGTDWVDPAARVLSTHELACPRLAFIRDPHWSERLDHLALEIDEDLGHEHPPEDRALLEIARTRVRHLADAARERCDLTSIWTDPVRPSCTNLVEDEYYACGVFPWLPPGRLAGAETRGDLHEPLRYAYEPGAFGGPLYVLVDGYTASAAEYFAAMLVDGDAATLYGQRTAGSGCGYTNGGVPVDLHHSGLRVEMPDCQRRRRDGGNELAGITPHVPIDWSPDDDAKTRRGKLFAALRGS